MGEGNWKALAMAEHLGDDLSPKPDPILGPSLCSQSSSQPGCVVRAPKQGPKPQEVPPALWGCSKPHLDVTLFHPELASWTVPTSLVINRSSGPSKAHIQGPLCAWHWVLRFASTQVGGPFSPFTEAAVLLGRGLQSPWGACCWLLSALLNGQDPCRHAPCCHGSPAVNEHL